MPPADEPHGQTKRAGMSEDELAGVAGGTKDGERAVVHSGSIWFWVWQSRLRSAPMTSISTVERRRWELPASSVRAASPT